MTIISRSTGWYANIIEQRKEKKLLYIYLDYIGPDNKELPKMSERPKL